MTMLLLALLVAFAAMTGIVLADSGLRMWSALGGIRAQQAMLRGDRGDAGMRPRCNLSVTFRTGHARPVARAGSAPLRAVA